MTDVYDAIIDKLEDAVKVLDLGAGEGELGTRLRDSGFLGTYRAVENNPELVLCLKQNHFKVDEGDICWLDYSPRSFDAVVMKDVMEYLPSLFSLVKPICFARRTFILVTQAPIVDAISPTPQGIIHYNIDDVISMARTANFQLLEYKMIGRHSMFVFKRKWRTK